MTTINNTQLGAKFLDMQAAVGVTKHIGGFAATNEQVRSGSRTSSSSAPLTYWNCPLKRTGLTLSSANLC